MLFETCMQTDTGRVRKNNEDSCFTFDTGNQVQPGRISYGIYIVADGMGGHQAGEIASNKAVDIIRTGLLQNIEDLSVSDVNTTIREIFQKANSEIYTTSINDPLLNGMGTTATLGLRIHDRLFIGHVGDSRAYLLRAGEIKQLTRDHSLVENLKNAGLITDEESKTHPNKNVITRAIGTSANIVVDSLSQMTNTDSLQFIEKDSLLLCTDGLINLVNDNEILEIVNNSMNARDACRVLIQTANQRGGNDNITVIVVNSI
jgi:serine/threonine protein phosphatase PrpC